ncbi:hypothetical protein L198_03214 [Cryptococcus wingfieldii CBS 7118]|uniref:DUF427 domain-containing protein n=1 Tax=Cryptococcus wingfieldii CBS 7118 TaxID=1295528 RepID=A0A1E3JEW9_9TREE|nr:hypothetical protein L198_03214 [Cryptococcus wingfieldii CBS 7118]ODN99372.1 hypothetical protein L198_03214 [Cryptococcus wingfieldii CBS 7118]
MSADQQLAVFLGDKILAQAHVSDLTHVEGNWYFPDHALLDRGRYTQSETTTHCPWKGDASYYNYKGDDGELKDIACADSIKSLSGAEVYRALARRELDKLPSSVAMGNQMWALEAADYNDRDTFLKAVSQRLPQALADIDSLSTFYDWCLPVLKAGMATGAVLIQKVQVLEKELQEQRAIASQRTTSRHNAGGHRSKGKRPRNQESWPELSDDGTHFLDGPDG